MNHRSSRKPKKHKRPRFGIKIDRTTKRRTYNMQVRRQCDQCRYMQLESMQGVCVCQCGGKMQLVAFTW